MANMKIELPGLSLKNPVIPASGTFGYGEEFTRFFDLNVLGSISIKGTTLEKRYGNPLPRIAEGPAGLLNAIGLQNPGVHHVTGYELPSFADYIETARILSQADNIGALELNISCPNVADGGMQFGTDPMTAAKLTSEVKKVSAKPVYVKLSPNVTDITEIACAVEKAGADGISMINTLVGMRFDIKTGKPIIANKTGGYSGPAILPIALRMVYQVSLAVSIPVIGMGGISSGKDAVEMMIAGASAVQIGCANLIDPYACPKIINEMNDILDRMHIKDVKDIIGLSHQY